MQQLHRCASVLAMLVPLAIPGQSATAQEGHSGTASPQRAARDWAVDAAANEQLVIDLKGSYVRYRLHSVGPRGDNTRDTFETEDGPVARLVLRDGKPLTPDEDAAERERLQSLLDDPAAYRKHVKTDAAGKKTAADLIRLLPDAMVFHYVPGQPQRTGAAGEVVLDYTPNPDWKPPTTVSEALTGLEGRVWIDPKTKRLTRLDGNVFRPINLGFGVLVHVNPGGTYSIEQVPVSGERWIVSRFSEHFSLKALLVKNVREDQEIESSGFTPVKGVGYQDAIRLLLATPLPR